MFKTILILIVGFLGLACAEAFAQQCLPDRDNATYVATPLKLSASPEGVCVKWHCAERGTGRLQTNTYCGTLAELPKVGRRLQTIMKSADPLKSVQTAGSRFTILPLSDPMFDGMPK